MGLPLYVAPVESDLQDKNTLASAASRPQSQIFRTSRRTGDAIRETRRRAILAENVRDRTDFPAFGRNLDTPSDDTSHIDAATMALASQAITASINAGPISLPPNDIPRGEDPSSNPERQPEMRRRRTGANRDRLLRVMEQERRANEIGFLRRQARRTGMTLEEIYEYAARTRAQATTRDDSHATSSTGQTRESPNHGISPLFSLGDSTGQSGRPMRPHELVPTPAYGQSIASTERNTANDHYAQWADAVFQGRGSARSTSSQARRLWSGTSSGPNHSQSDEIGNNNFMSFDEPAAGDTGRSRFRLVTYPVNTQPLSSFAGRHPPDRQHMTRMSLLTDPILTERVNESARLFFQTNDIVRDNGHGDTPPPGSLGANRSNDHGERVSSPNEPENVWDILLATVTPDPQPPSFGASFTSSAEALGPSNPRQPRVSNGHPAGQRGPSPPTAPADLHTAAHRSEEVGVGLPPAARSTGMPTTRQSTSSGPVTATSASAARQTLTPLSQPSSADPGVVANEEEDCFVDPNPDAHGEDYDMDEEDAQDEETAEYLGLERESRLRTSGASATQAGAIQEIQRRQTDGSPRYGEPDAAWMDAVFGVSRARLDNPMHPDNVLHSVDVQGMQHIVRSLARREDIPDEWWAEAGLSRTLSREALD